MRDAKSPKMAHQLFLLPRFGVEHPPRFFDDLVAIEQIAGKTIRFGG